MISLIPQTITVPAVAGGQEGLKIISAAGKYLYIQRSDAAISVRFDAGAPTTCRTGLLIPGEFSRLTFLNALGIPVEVVFLVSSEPIPPGYLSSGQTQVGSSTALGHGAISLAASGTLTLPGTSNGQNRKQIVVRNLDANFDIEVLDAGGNLFYTIEANEPWTFETDATFIIQNANAQAVEITVGETFYT